MAARFARAGTNGVDAVIAAVAALKRLEQESLLAERLDPEIFTPQVGQGAVALEARSGENAERVLRSIDDERAHRCVEAERAFLVGIGAGCTVPAGAWCTEEKGTLRLRAVMASSSGRLERSVHEGNDPIVLGAACANDLAWIAGSHA